MQKNSQDKLAEVIHRELMKLPERPAPETLVTRVLARIEQRKRHWWKQPWPNWPFLARVISLPAMLLCAASFVVGLWLLLRLNVSEWIMAQTSELVRPLVPTWEFGLALMNTILLSLRSLEQHWVLLSAMVAFLMYLTCVAVGTACYRVALQKH
jgi:hypothetical protein